MHFRNPPPGAARYHETSSPLVHFHSDPRGPSIFVFRPCVFLCFWDTFLFDKRPFLCFVQWGVGEVPQNVGNVHCTLGGGGDPPLIRGRCTSSFERRVVASPLLPLGGWFAPSAFSEILEFLRDFSVFGVMQQHNVEVFFWQYQRKHLQVWEYFQRRRSSIGVQSGVKSILSSYS